MDNGLKLLISQLSNVGELEALTLDSFLPYHSFYNCNYFYPLSSMRRPTTAILCYWKDFSNSFPHSFFQRFCCFSFSLFKIIQFHTAFKCHTTEICDLCYLPWRMPYEDKLHVLEVVWNWTINKTQLNIALCETNC